VWVPPAATLDEIDKRWDSMCASNPACFDGELLHVLGAQRNGCGGANVHLIPCSYRFFAVQTDAFDIGVRSLGAKGITKFDGKYLWGKRSDSVLNYQLVWELAPAGCVEPTVKPATTIELELQEETGLELARPPKEIALIQDPIARTWELIYELQVKSSDLSGNHEYTELCWRESGDVPTERSPITNDVLTLLDV
jgi:8-oxo-dGTP pyrophosphatase MutT (NUDIX family)|tara:strand:- start:1303 stop:1887 length:585 start_codon:yes stop_codon:yes gene_type:complete